MERLFKFYKGPKGEIEAEINDELKRGWKIKAMDSSYFERSGEMEDTYIGVYVLAVYYEGEDIK